ncbi:MAG: FapA family protein [bacterium]
MTDKKKENDSANLGDEFLQEFKDFEAKHDGKAGRGDSDEPMIVKISEDKLKATVNVAPPLDASGEVTKEDIVSALKGKGVVFGIDEDAIEEIHQFGSFNVDVPVARGREPSDGESAKIEYQFDTSGETKAKLEVDEHGNVDHKSVRTIASVEQGVVVAVKIPAIKGEPGMMVTGQTIPAVEGKDVTMPAGENVEVSEDGNSLVATISGQPVLKDGRVSVSAVYEIKGDVSYATGNVDFRGTVVIHGGVQSDFVVRATDDIEIWGNIEKALIEADGDIRCRGGLYGQGEGKLVAGGSVTVRSVESGTVEAGKNITITQSSRYSELLAGEDVILNNVKGSIVGGRLTAGRVIDVTNLGSPSFTETTVEVGFNPKVKELQVKLEEKVKEEKQQMEKVMHSIKTVKDLKEKGELPPDKAELMKKLVPAAHQLRASLEENEAKLNFVYEKQKSMQVGRLKVKNVVFPGVKISTVNSNMSIRKEIKHSSFYEQNEQVMVGPY